MNFKKYVENIIFVFSYILLTERIIIYLFFILSNSTHINREFLWIIFYTYTGFQMQHRVNFERMDDGRRFSWWTVSSRWCFSFAWTTNLLMDGRFSHRAKARDFPLRVFHLLISSYISTNVCILNHAGRRFYSIKYFFSSIDFIDFFQKFQFTWNIILIN